VTVGMTRAEHTKPGLLVILGETIRKKQRSSSEKPSKARGSYGSNRDDYGGVATVVKHFPNVQITLDWAQLFMGRSREV
jgi:hypothetical protein